MSDSADSKKAEQTIQAAEAISAAVTSAAAEAAAAEAKQVVTFDEQGLSERMERAKRSAIQKKIKEYGFETDDELKGYLQEARMLKEKAEERRLAEMSELERERQGREAAERRAQEFEERAHMVQIDNHLMQVCNEHGVRDWKYFKYRVLDRANALSEGEELDEVEFLKELLQDASQRAALGVAALPSEATVQNVQSPAHTTPVTNPRPGTYGGPPSAPSTAQPTQNKTSFELNSDEWANKKRAIGIPF